MAAEDYFPTSAPYDEREERERYYEGDGRAPRDPPLKRCKYCGLGGLHWETTTKGSWRLFTATGDMHHCPKYPKPRWAQQLIDDAKQQPPPLAEATVGKEKPMATRNVYTEEMRSALRICFNKGEPLHEVLAYAKQRWPELTWTRRRMFSLRWSLLNPERKREKESKNNRKRSRGRRLDESCEVVITFPGGELRQKTDRATAGALMAMLVENARK